MKRKLFVLPDGSTIGRWHDSMVHAGARPTKVLRVSSVEWDEVRKQWAAKISTMTMWSPTRAQALVREGELIDRLLADTVQCWNPKTGDFECPKCHGPVVPVDMIRCPSCGYAFLNIITGLKLSDLPFRELLTAL